jgi:tetratricopeptide (TPR) repeat protein
VIKRLLSYSIFLLFFSLCHGQSNIKADSLKHELSGAFSDTSRANLLVEISKAYTGPGPLDSTLRYAQDAYSLSMKAGYKRGQAESLMRLAIVSLQKRQYTNAIQELISSSRLYHELNDKPGEELAFFNLGSSYSSHEDYVEAVKTYLIALKIAEGIKDTLFIININILIANVYQNINQGSEALKYLFHAQKIAEDAFKKFLLGGVLGNIANCYFKMNDNEKALEYNFKALKMSEGDISNRSVLLLNNKIGNIYSRIHRLNEALKYHLYALDIARESGNKKDLSDTYYYLGNIYIELKKDKEALSYYFLSIKYCNEYDAINFARTYFKISELYLSENKLDSAKYYSSLYLNLNRNALSKEVRMKGLLLLSKLDSAGSDYKSALTNYLAYISLKDSVNDNEGQKKLAFLSLEYQFERSQDSSTAGQRKADQAKAYERTMNETLFEQHQRNLLLKEQEIDIEKQELELAANQKDIEKIAILKAKAENKEKEVLVLSAEKDNLIQAALISNLKKNRNLIAGLFTFLLIVSVLILYFLAQRKKIIAQQQLSVMEMKALRAQMNPHFIFNSLNSIHSFMQANDYSSASAYLVRFSKLIRLTLENSMYSLVSLEDEIKALDIYLSLESERMKKRFTYKINIDGKIKAGNILIPPLLFQPYVENSIWHGMHDKTYDGLIEINIRIENNILYCSITDNRSSMKPMADESKKTMGSSITQERILILNQVRKTKGYVNRIHIEEQDKTGVRVELAIPVELG